MEQRLAWHTDQFTEPKRSTVHLARFARRLLGDVQLQEVADFGCGAGANMFHLSALAPGARWVGVDRDEECIALGRAQLDPGVFTFVEGDLFDLPRELTERRFDCSFSIATLSWLKEYERPVEQMLRLTRGWIFFSSLFSESKLDALTRVVGRMPGAEEGYEAFYNVYSLPRFERFCRALGARELVAERFEIDIDIERPGHGGMGSWTERMADGRRLQFSGPIAMPLWFVAVHV